MGLWRYFRRRDEDAELAREIEGHVAIETEENIARGMDAVEARRRALVRFGSATNVREDVWEWNTVGVMEGLWKDLRYVERTLRRAPGFALAVFLVMALGIGSVTAMFTIVRSVLLKPLPFKEPSRLLRLYEGSADDGFTDHVIAGGVFQEWKKQSLSFSDLAVVLTWPEYNLSAAGGQLPERVRATQCSWNLFSTLGVEPVIGRVFTEAEDQRSANAVVVLSWGLWKARFGGDPAILNQNIHLDGKSYAVIGVMPASFAYPEYAVQLWTPIYHEQPDSRWQQLNSHMFVSVGRLNPGATPAQANAELSLVNSRLHDEHPDDPFIFPAASTRPLLDDTVGKVSTPLYVLLGATGCLLFIACLNVAGLLVARGTTRRKEFAIRSALGGGRWRLLGEHLIESLVLCGAGGVAGLIGANSVIQWFVSTRPDMSRVETIYIDRADVAFAVALIFICALFAGLVSAFSMDGSQILSALQEAARTHSASRGRVRMRKWLLGLQVAFTVALLIGAGLLLKSYTRLRSFDLGCDPKNALTMRFALPEAQYGQPARRAIFWQKLMEEVRSVPGVQAVILGDLVPGQGYGWDNYFGIGEHPRSTTGPGPGLDAIVHFADSGYFSALGIPLLRGQAFDEDQRPDHMVKAIVNDSFAKQFFPNEDPIGKHLLIFEKAFEIIGEVGDTRYLVAKPPAPIMYFPVIYSETNRATLVVRSTRDVTALAIPIQQIVQRVDPDLPVSDVLTMEQIIGKSTLDASFDATMVGLFAGLSLVLASVGLYGVLSYLVAQRKNEIGVRIALGAQRGQVLRLTLADGIQPTAVGLAFGLAAGAAAARSIRDLLYGIEPLDASVFLGVAIVSLVVAIAACLLPAWRASRLDPVVALRSE